MALREVLLRLANLLRSHASRAPERRRCSIPAVRGDRYRAIAPQPAHGSIPAVRATATIGYYSGPPHGLHPRCAGSPSAPKVRRSFPRSGRWTQSIEGGGFASRVIIIEFDSQEQAMNWYNCPEYQAIVPIRQANSTTRAAYLTGAWGGPRPRSGQGCGWRRGRVGVPFDQVGWPTGV